MLPRGLTSIALGHMASVVVVAGAAVFPLGVGRTFLLTLALGLLATAVLMRIARRAPAAVRGPARGAGVALGSFAVSTAHGSGLMLVPALMPLCSGAGSTTGSLEVMAPALGAMAAHALVMIAVTGVLAGCGSSAWKTSAGMRCGWCAAPCMPRQRGG